MQLVTNWKDVLLRSWSARFAAIGGVCAILMEYTDYLDFLPKWVLVLIAGLGIYSRVVDQGLAAPKSLEHDDDIYA